MADDDRKLSELIPIRFTAGQVRDIKRRARWHRTTHSSMIRDAALAVHVRVPESQVEERRFLKALQQIGQRVNQMARLANTFKAIELVEDDLHQLLGELRSALADFDADHDHDHDHDHDSDE